jgi:membrane fusion protein (multidrug efflux system)
VADLKVVSRVADEVEAFAPAQRDEEAPLQPVQAEAAPARRRGKRLLGGVGGIVLVAAVVLGFQYQAVWAHQVSTDNAYVRADITPVAAKVEGYVARLAVDDNQAVKAGDVLLTIDPADHQAKVAKAEADLASARAGLQALIAARGSAAAQAGAQSGIIGEASANLVAARANAARAAADAARFEQLAERGWTTRARLDQARAEAQSARAAIVAAEAAISARRGQAGALLAGTAGADANILGGQAQVQAAEAALKQVRLDLQRTVVRSPVDGVVGNRTVRAGQLIRPGQALLAIVPVQASYVVANFKETQLGKMRLGQPVTISVDAYSGLEIRGRIESLAPASGAQFALIPTDSATGNFTKIVQRVPVKIRIEGDSLAAHLLRPGLSVEATVDTSR